MPASALEQSAGGGDESAQACQGKVTKNSVNVRAAASRDAKKRTSVSSKKGPYTLTGEEYGDDRNLCLIEYACGNIGYILSDYVKIE